LFPDGASLNIKFKTDHEILMKSSKKILFVSNGHGEDLNASEVLKALNQRYPQIEVAALPMVGAGNAYRKLGVEIIASTQNLPSGGFVYMDSWKLIADLKAGLIGLTWQQIQAILAQRARFDLIFATGDVVPLAIARLSGCPYLSFMVSASAHYENRMAPPFLTNWLLRSPLCRLILTRDALTAQLMQQQGILKAVFAGYPIMDILEPTGKDLELDSQIPMIALLPGSRPPEACRNLGLILDLVKAIAHKFDPEPIQFRAALIPEMIKVENLTAIANDYGWELQNDYKLVHGKVEVGCYGDAFADILQQCRLVIGMAGTAVEQAVGLGKPVIQIPGGGPQFTYSFAEAQMRLLGKSVQTIGKEPANYHTLEQAADQVKLTLGDSKYLLECSQNGRERVGLSGGSAKIADHIAQIVGENAFVNI
jgi:uncharacterized protein (TIGR03492 family)